MTNPARKPAVGPRDESLEQFVTRRFGPEVLRNLVGPFVSGIYAGDPARLSARAVFPEVVELEEKHGSVLKGILRSARSSPKRRPPRLLASFREGLHALPRALAGKLGGGAILLGARVEELTPKPRAGRNRFALGLRTGSEKLSLEADAVVLAVPAYHAADLVRPLSAALAVELAGVEYPPLASVCIAFRKGEVPRPLDGFGFLVPRGEGVRSLGCIWSSSLFPGRAPEGSALLTLFLGGATDPEIASLPDDAVTARAQSDLESTLGIAARGRVLQLERHPRAIPQYTLGHLERLDRVGKELSRFPGLFLAGNYLRGVSIGDCARQACKLAATVMAPPPG